MRVAMGGGYGGMVGGGGSGGMGMMEDPTLWGKIMAFLDTLPVWLSTIIIAGVVILGAMLVGWIIGQIVGRVIYPNPDKPSVLNKKEKLVYMGILSAAVVLVIVMAMPKTDEDLAVSGDMGGTGGDMNISGDPNGVGGKDDMLESATDGTTSDGASSDGVADDTSSSDTSTPAGDSSSSSGSSASSSSSSTASSGTTNAPAGAANPKVAVTPSVG